MSPGLTTASTKNPIYISSLFSLANNPSFYGSSINTTLPRSFIRKPIKEHQIIKAVNSSASVGQDRNRSSIDPERTRKFNELIQEMSSIVLSTGPRGAVRFIQGVQAFAEVSTEYLLEQAQANSTRTQGNVLLSPPGPAQLRKLFEKLGATYVKLGQFIASAPTLFPSEYVSEFQKCLDRTPPIPFDNIRSIIREDLGRPLESVYEYIDPTPLASASVAQVHAAKLKGSGTNVVIKVLKPGVEDTLVTDLNFLYLSARVLEFLNPDISRTSVVGIIQDIRTSMMEEVDFLKEAVNIESFNNYIYSMGLSQQAIAPTVYKHCTTKRVLTMERFYGVPLTDLTSIQSFVSNPETTLITALNVWFGSLLACETFHADVHAGNLLVLKDGRIGFIDFGIVGRISPGTWVAVEKFLLSVGTSDYRTMAVALTQMGATDETVDLESFSKDLAAIFVAVQDLDPDIAIRATQSRQGTTVAATLSIDEQQVNALLLDVIRVSERYGLRFPREFGLLLKQLLYFDRYTRLLAPNLNMLDDDRVTIGSPSRRNYGY